MKLNPTSFLHHIDLRPNLIIFNFHLTYRAQIAGILYAGIGLLVSIQLAISINPDINREVMELGN